MTRWLGMGCGLVAFAMFCGVGLSISAILAVFSPETDAASGFLASDTESARSTSPRSSRISGTVRNFGLRSNPL